MFNRTRVRRLLAAFLFAVLAQGSWAATITVTSSGDVSAFDGACTLREAITVIMGSGPSTFDCPNVGFAFGTNDQVIFNISGAGVHTIAPTSALPRITKPVLINGYSQPGASQNTLVSGWNAVIRIELDGSSAGSAVSGLVIDTEYARVQGLAIFGFSDDGILLGSPQAVFTNIRQNRIYGNIIGLRADGTTAAGNGWAGVHINIGGGSSNHWDNYIGHTNPEMRNIISANGSDGVYIYSGSNEWVMNNYIGVDSSGVLARGNGYGVTFLELERSHIGDNIISGNSSAGIDLSAHSTGNRVYRNRIGVNALGDPLGNGYHGVEIWASQNEINGGNIIAANKNAGIAIFNSSNTGILITGSSIYSNGGLGIDLAGNGSTANDPGDSDAGPNGFQNFPVLTVATQAGVILGTLNSTANANFVIEFFSSPVCDGSGHGEGQTFLGRTTVPTNGLGDAAIVFGAGALTPGSAITATARNAATNDTSEFSACISVAAAAGPEIEVSGNAVPIADGDGTPSIVDGTVFGNTTVGTPVTRTFNIGNTGLSTLNLGANAVSLSGASCAEFSVIAQPPTTVSAGGSAAFQIQYLPTNLGSDDCAVALANDDSDENPFNFAIRGTAIAAAGPEIEVSGTGVLITDGDVSPSLADGTDFGNTTIGGAATRSFAVENTGTSTLNLGASAVSLSGAGCGEFTVIAQPAATVAAGGMTSFQIQYLPTNLGIDTCAVALANDDTDENPFNFDIQGTGIAPAPEISISGQGVSISDGAVIASLADWTDFGSTTVGAAITRAFLINNFGTAALNLGANAVSLTGGGCGEFSVLVQPATTVAPGGSTSFQVRYLPTNAGADSCTVNVANDDTNESPFDFAIQGTAAADPASGAAAIPTLSPWGLGLLTGFLGLAFYFGQRRRRH